MIAVEHVWTRAGTFVKDYQFLLNSMSPFPKRFDVIVFKHPWGEDREFIKRVIALPGDRLQVRNRQVYVNGQLLREPYVRYMAQHSRGENFGPVVVPQKGDTIESRGDKQLYLNGELIPIPPGRYYPQSDGPMMLGFKVFYGPLFPAGTTLQEPAGPFVVQHNYYFTLGDTRDNSKDSRHWGFVPDTNILGLAKRFTGRGTVMLSGCDGRGQVGLFGNP